MTDAAATVNEPDVTISVTMGMWLGACEWRTRLWLSSRFVMLAARVLVYGVALGFGEDEGRTDEAIAAIRGDDEKARAAREARKETDD